ncbi:efflux RND transporter periplasmic adaptor subunit [Govanella unica]|uniref:Efflux RND transporter periplasmic adaptor subunit n=1 Tax=Govanella unica TaxID=2975056 RepID=A0A9X3TY24_9PROT|nr:efflux RND transporter periplasmic adaptor subunit [Govania unica]MDA5193901.1 efflux RND transporter periplasmic adaptor subunit [Govania unica]
MRSQIKTLTAVGLLLAAALTVAACEKKNEAPQGRAPEVAVVTVKPQKLSLTTELVGRTTSYQVAEVRPQVTGIVLKRLFREGGEVKAGESLYQIDPATYQATLSSAKADLARAEANATTARLKAGRFTELVAINAVSKQDHDDAVAALKQADAAVAASRAAVQQADINLRYTKVVSPISGRIGRSLVTPGALVTANQAASLATVQQLDPIYVDVSQSSTELMKLRRNLAESGIQKEGSTKAKVKLILEDGTAYPLEGTLEFAEVTVDPTTGSVILRALFPNPKHELLPGMYVRAVLGEGVKQDAMLAPQQAVSRDPKGNATTFVVSADNKVEQRMIVTGRSVGDQWLVTEGLNPGDRVVVEGFQRIRPGAPVKAVELEAPSAAAPTAKARK